MRYVSLTTIIADHPFFNDLDEPYVEIIAGCARNVAFATGTTIFREGEDANAFYLIRQGDVALTLHRTRRGAQLIQTIHENDVLGWSWLFPPHRWYLDATALSPVRAISFDGVCLRGKCDADPRLGYLLMQRFASKIVERLQLMRLQLLDVYGDVNSRSVMR